MSWYKLTLSGDDRVDQMKSIQDEFGALWSTAPVRNDMALFSGGDLLSDEIVLYFTPACAVKLKALIDSYGADPCETPSRNTLSLLFGPSDAMERLRPPKDA